HFATPRQPTWTRPVPGPWPRPDAARAPGTGPGPERLAHCAATLRRSAAEPGRLMRRRQIRAGEQLAELISLRGADDLLKRDQVGVQPPQLRLRFPFPACQRLLGH